MNKLIKAILLGLFVSAGSLMAAERKIFTPNREFYVSTVGDESRLYMVDSENGNRDITPENFVKGEVISINLSVVDEYTADTVEAGETVTLHPRRVVYLSVLYIDDSSEKKIAKFAL